MQDSVCLLLSTITWDASSLESWLIDYYSFRFVSGMYLGLIWICNDCGKFNDPSHKSVSNCVCDPRIDTPVNLPQTHMPFEKCLKLSITNSKPSDILRLVISSVYYRRLCDSNPELSTRCMLGRSLISESVFHSMASQLKGGFVLTLTVTPSRSRSRSHILCLSPFMESAKVCRSVYE